MTRTVRAEHPGVGHVAIAKNANGKVFPVDGRHLGILTETADQISATTPFSSKYRLDNAKTRNESYFRFVIAILENCRKQLN
jgi:hypothetical protein